MRIFPKDVEEKITQLGYFVVNVIPLYKAWSIIGLKEEQKYNIQLGAGNLSVLSIHLLRYRFNQWGSRVIGVERVLTQHKDSAEVRVI